MRLGMDPVTTLYKYDEPVCLEQMYGGWTNRAMIDEFVAFARTCFEEYGDLISKWITFNEINVLIGFPDAQSDNILKLHHQMVAAARVERVHDSYRINYLREHIAAMRAAVEEDGVNLFGYITWGPIDLVAASTGKMSKRHGFIYVDMDDAGAGDLHRVRKDSFWWYRRVCRSNGEELA